MLEKGFQLISIKGTFQVYLHSQNLPRNPGLQIHKACSLTLLQTPLFLHGFVVQGLKPVVENRWSKKTLRRKTRGNV